MCLDTGSSFTPLLIVLIIYSGSPEIRSTPLNPLTLLLNLDPVQAELPIQLVKLEEKLQLSSLRHV